MNVTIQELLRAGYKPEQILSCPLGDPCPCQTHGPQKSCGLGQTVSGDA